MRNSTLTLVGLMFLSASPTLYASKLFISNNQGVISPDNAYARMQGGEQADLLAVTTSTLQEDRYQQGSMYSVLGAYYMQSSNQITADNTLLFVTSPQESRSNDQLFKTAAGLASQFHQESVAVFIDDGNKSGSDTIITFNDLKPSYVDLKKKMKWLENNGLSAFSISFEGNQQVLANAKIASIEWLTTPEKNKILSKLFANVTLTTTYGDAFLVFQNGGVELLGD